MTIPIFNVYASTSLTEPLSNAYLAFVLLLYLIYGCLEREKKDSVFSNILGLSAIAFTMIFSILIKTANISLVFCLPIAGLISLIGNKKFKDSNKRNRFLISLLIIFIVFVFSVLVLGFQTAVEINRGDIGVNPFSFSFFKALAPMFAESFFNIQWYLAYSLLFVLGIFFGLKKKKAIFPIVIFIFYFVLYAAHYRSYYFTKGIPVIKDEAIRYMSSIAFVYSIIVGLGIYYLWEWLKKLRDDRAYIYISKSISIALAIFVLAFSVCASLNCRAYFVEDEYNVRISPVLKTLEYLRNRDDILITSEHVLFQIYGSPDLKLIDFCSIDNLISIDEIDNIIRSKDVFYLAKMERDSVDEQRYKQQCLYIDSKEKEVIYLDENYKLYRLTRKTAN